MATLPVIIDAARARSGANEAKKALDGIKRSAEGADAKARSLNRTLTSTGKAGSKAASSLKALLGGFTAFVAIRSAVKSISDFEESMATLRGVANIPSELDARFKALEATAKQLGATTRFTATEAAEGLTFLARAGFSAEQAIDAIPATLNLASAGMLSLGQAADFASNIVSQFGLQAAETERVVDTLVKTSNSSNTSVLQLAEALKFAGPIAGTLGNTVEETAAALGALGNRGIQASLAGTNLRGILAALLSPSEGATDSLRRLGISLSEIDPNTRTINEIFKVFKDRGIDAAAAIDLFGRRNAAAALILADSTEITDGLTKANQESAGAAAKQASIVEDTLAGAFRTLKSAVEALFISTGDNGLAGALRDVVTVLTGAVRIFTGAEANVGELNSAAEKLVFTIKALAAGFIVLKAVKIASFIGSISFAIIGLDTTVKALTLSLLANPLFALGAGAFLLGFIATTAIIKTFTDDTEDATEAVKKEALVLEDLKSSLDQVRNAQKRFNDADNAGKGAKQEGLDAIAAQIKGFKDLESQILSATNAGAKFVAPEAFNFNLGGPGTATAAQPEEIIQDIRVRIEEQSGADALKFFDKLQRETNNLQGLLELTREAFLEQERAATRAAEARTREIEEAAKIKDETDAILQEVKALELEVSLLEESESTRTRSRLSVELLGKAFSDLTFDQQELVTQLELTKQGIEDVAKANEELARRDALAQNIDSFVQGLKDEIRLLESSKGEREKIVAVRQLEALVSKEGFELTSENLSEEIELVRSLVDQKQKLIEAETERSSALRIQEEGQRDLNEAAAGANSTFEANLESLRQEIDLMGLSNQEAEKRRALKLAEIDLQAQVTAGILTQQEAEMSLNEFRGEFDELQRLQRIQELANDVGAAFNDAFEALISGSASGKEVLSSLARQLAAAVVQALVLKPILEAITSSAGGSGGAIDSIIGGLFAKGGAFSGGNVIAMARGEIIGGPTLKPMSGGRTALLGERGPEAVVPLSRGPGGRLGIEGGGGTNNTFQVTINGVRDFDSFRQSERQLKSSLQRLAGTRTGAV